MPKVHLMLKLNFVCVCVVVICEDSRPLGERTQASADKPSHSVTNGIKNKDVFKATLKHLHSFEDTDVENSLSHTWFLRLPL